MCVFPIECTCGCRSGKPAPLTPVAQLVDGAGNVIFSDKVVEDPSAMSWGSRKAQSPKHSSTVSEGIVQSDYFISGADHSDLSCCSYVQT